MGRRIVAAAVTGVLTLGVGAGWVGLVEHFDGPGYERCGDTCDMTCSTCTTSNTIVRGQ